MCDLVGSCFRSRHCRGYLKLIVVLVDYFIPFLASGSHWKYHTNVCGTVTGFGRIESIGRIMTKNAGHWAWMSGM